MAKSEFTVGHMATGHLFGLAPLWEGEVSVYIPDISDGAQQESVWSGEPKGEALVLFYLVWLWLGALLSQPRCWCLETQLSLQSGPG